MLARVSARPLPFPVGFRSAGSASPRTDSTATTPSSSTAAANSSGGSDAASRSPKNTTKAALVTRHRGSVQPRVTKARRPSAGMRCRLCLLRPRPLLRHRRHHPRHRSRRPWRAARRGSVRWPPTTPRTARLRDRAVMYCWRFCARGVASASRHLGVGVAPSSRKKKRS